MGLLRFFQSNEKAEKQEDTEVVKSQTTITGTKGQYEGCIIEFDKTIVIGRDPQKSELIIDDSNVSRKHCSIVYNPEEQNYIVNDFSTNGTYLGRECIGKDNSRTVPRGTFIIIGQSGNNFRLD